MRWVDRFANGGWLRAFRDAADPRFILRFGQSPPSSCKPDLARDCSGHPRDAWADSTPRPARAEGSEAPA